MNPKINKKWKNEIDEIFLILNKRIFIAVLIFIKLMFICLLIENSLSSGALQVEEASTREFPHPYL